MLWHTDKLSSLCDVHLTNWLLQHLKATRVHVNSPHSSKAFNGCRIKGGKRTLMVEQQFLESGGKCLPNKAWIRSLNQIDCSLSLSLHYACKHNQSHAICVQCNQEAESSRIWRCRCHHWGESRREMFETQSTLQCSNFTALLCFFRHKHSLLGSVKSKSSTSSEALLGCKSKRFLKMVGWYLKILVKMTVGKTMSCLPSPSHHHVDRWYV